VASGSSAADAARSQQEAVARAKMAYERRYGPTRNRLTRSNAPSSPQPSATIPQPAGPVGPASSAASGPVKTGPTVVLDEKQLKVVMLVSIVKLESKTAAPGIVKFEPKPAAAR
jgi:hypothetical protein